MSPTHQQATAARRALACAVAFLSTLVLPGRAWAHGSAALGDFYGGLLHPVLHFETLLPIVAAALWTVQLGKTMAWRLAGGLLVATLVGCVAGVVGVGPIPALAILRIAMLVLGLLVATHCPAPATVAAVLLAVVGICVGHATSYGAAAEITRPVLFVAGVSTGTGLLLFHIIDRFLRLRAAWSDIPIRILGSWIAATGLLVSALDLAGRR